ncbi:membrane protein PM19L [Impatiens glandulifera]|uniref:membrane protein PM19L n=1 Tax=Impatiens glandulifera TaxID=253017 RepID=UPI001FB0BD56|nr:membrane protein PM19L [Impatiens glandulifera]
MVSGGIKTVASSILVLHLVLYFIVVIISGWAVNHGIEEARETASSLTIPARIFPIYYPFGNDATGFLVIFSLIAGVVGCVSSVSCLNNVGHWTRAHLHAAAASSLLTWALTVLAMGVACKEINVERTNGNLRILENIMIVLSGTQFLCTLAIHAGVEDVVKRQIF